MSRKIPVSMASMGGLSAQTSRLPSWAMMNLHWIMMYVWAAFGRVCGQQLLSFSSSFSITLPPNTHKHKEQKSCMYELHLVKFAGNSTVVALLSFFPLATQLLHFPPSEPSPPLHINKHKGQSPSHHWPALCLSGSPFSGRTV